MGSLCSNVSLTTKRKRDKKKGACRDVASTDTRAKSCFGSIHLWQTFALKQLYTASTTLHFVYIP